MTQQSLSGSLTRLYDRQNVMTMPPFPRLWPMILLAALCFATPFARAEGQSGDGRTGKSGLPPSWLGAPDGRTKDRGNPFTDDRRHQTAPSEPLDSGPKLRQRPWYVPRASLGLSTNLPELFTIESHLTFGHYVGLHLFYSPPIPITVRVEMPSDLIVVKSNVGLANPAFNINGQLTYGEQYGAEALAFPFGGSFFIMGGASHRRIRLVADAQTPVLICSGSAILTPNPCSDSKATITSQIQLKAHADVITEATLLRSGIGWFWHIGSFGYFTFNLGAAKPMGVKHNASLDAAIVTPAGSDAELNAALEQMRTKKLSDLRQQTLDATKPVDRQVLPILGIGAGVRF